MNGPNQQFEPCCSYTYLGLGIASGFLTTVGTGAVLGRQVRVYQDDPTTTNLGYELLAIFGVAATSLTCLVSTYFCVREKIRNRRFNRVRPTEESQSTVVRGAITIRMHN